MKRDIQINISILEEIYRKVKTYIDALTQLEHASKEFEEAIKEQKSEAYEALSELWENNISQKESKIKWQLVIVAGLLKDYINAMQEYIQPVNETQNIRVDRDDILWNLQQINSYIYNFNWIANDNGQSWNDYSRPFVYDTSEDEETNEARRSIQEALESQERTRRQNNYNMLAAFREELKKESYASAYISTIYEEMCEIEKIYDNNIIPFENTDDIFAEKMKGYYDEWKSITNTVEDFTEVVYSFGRGLRQVGLDTLEDAIHMGNLLYVQELQATGQEVPEELQADVTTFINNLRDGISNIITDPGNTIEAIGQNIFDTVDKDGIAYATGYIAPEVAIALAAKKMTGKGPKVKGGTGMADDVVEEVLEDGSKIINQIDRIKIDGWDYTPNDELYIKYKDVFDNPKYYNQQTGAINWPENNGFSGTPIEEVLQPGTRIDRYGSDYGSFTSPEGTAYEMRAVAPGTDQRPHSVFEVVEPINVKSGSIAPWFDEQGGGMQYLLPDTVDELLDAGILRRIQ